MPTQPNFLRQRKFEQAHETGRPGGGQFTWRKVGEKAEGEVSPGRPERVPRYTVLICYPGSLQGYGAIV